MHFIQRSLLALTVVAFLSAPQRARAEQGEIIKELSADSVGRILQALNLEYKEITPGTYSFNLGGYKTLLINKGSNLQFYVSFKKKTTLPRINEWNAGKRYSRAYLDKQGDPVLESDLDLQGGVSYGALREFIDKWLKLVKLFTEHIGFQVSGGLSGSGA